MDATHDVEPRSAEELRMDIHETSEKLRVRYTELCGHVKRRRQDLAAKLLGSAYVSEHPISACVVAFCLGTVVGALRLDRSGARLLNRIAHNVTRSSKEAFGRIGEKIFADALKDSTRKFK